MENKKILFFNAVPMPHSILLHQKLVDAGYIIDFWYYKDLTNIYPWKKFNAPLKYNVFNNSFDHIKKVITSLFQSDLVIITGWHTRFHVVLMLLSKLFGKRYALWLDASNEPINSFKKLRNITLLRLSPLLFVTGEYGIKQLNKQYGIAVNKMKDFPYLCADFDSIKVREINEKRKNDLLYGSKIKLLISNRFIERKGYNTIINAFSILPKEIINEFQITVLGTGLKFDKYKNELLNNITNIDFLGWVEYDTYLRCLTECDIFLHASLDEPFGIPPMDAMFCGKLVISSDGVVSSMSRIINEINGFIYSKNDFHELASILSYLANNRWIIYQLGDKALETSKSYSYEYNIRSIQSALL